MKFERFVKRVLVGGVTRWLSPIRRVGRWTDGKQGWAWLKGVKVVQLGRYAATQIIRANEVQPGESGEIS